MRVVAHVGVALAVLSVATLAGAAEAGEAGAPLSLYPRRPGARYEDVETAPGRAAEVPFLVSILPDSASGGITLTPHPATLEPESNIPAGWKQPEPEEQLDDFAPHPALGGPVVHLSVDVDSSVLSSGMVAGIECSLTDPRDGARLVGISAPATLPFTTTTTVATSTTTTTTIAGTSSHLDAYVPVGDRRGVMYASCSLGLVLAYSANLVWRVDVGTQRSQGWRSGGSNGDV
jgi:hypothetical protein